MNGKISVITPAKKSETTIDRCVLSFLGQTYKNSEQIFIVLNDPADKTSNILANYQKNNDRRIKIKHYNKPGIYSAINFGIAHSKGDSILVLGSDDWLEPNGLELLLNSLTKQNADIAVGYAYIHNKNSTELLKIKNFDYRMLTGGMPFSHQALLVTKKCYDICGLYNETLEISSDYEWIKLAFLKKLRLAIVDKPVVNFSLGGASSNIEKYIEEHKNNISNTYNVPKEIISTYIDFINSTDELNEQDLFNLIQNSNHIDLIKSISLHLLDKLCKATNNKPLCPYTLLKYFRQTL